MNRIPTNMAVLAMALCTSMWAQQTPAPAPTSAPATTSAAATPSTRTKVKKAAPNTQVIGIEKAPPTPSTSPLAASETPAQRAADQQLLQQQQAQQAQAAAINTRQVQQLQTQQQQVQQEVRIQDAPGPAQTGVVPAAGTPVAPVNAGDRIQDAPGPAQTLPPLPTPAASPAANAGTPDTTQAAPAPQ